MYEDISYSIGELLSFIRIYKDNVFYFPEDKLFNHKYTKEEIKYYLDSLTGKISVLESSITVKGKKYLLSSSCSPMWKNKADKGNLNPNYYFFTCDTYDMSKKQFDHLSVIILKPGSDYMWIRHADEELEKVYDTSTLVVEGDKLKLCKLSIDDLIKGANYVDINKKLNDTVSAMMVCHILSALKRYSEVSSRERTVIKVESKENTNKKPRVSKASKHTKDICILDQDLVIPMSSINGVKRVYEKKAYQGGHHASPIPHDVTGHWRNYKSGKSVWIEGYHKNCPNYESVQVHKIIKVD